MQPPSFDWRSPLHHWAGLRMELCWIYSGAVQEASVHENADHRVGYRMWLLRKGSVRVESPSGTWQAKPGEWMLTPQEVLLQSFTKEASVLSLHFLCAWPGGVPLFSGKGCECWPASDFPRLERTAQRLNRLVHRHLPQVRTDFARRAVSLPVFLRFESLFRDWLAAFHDAMGEKGRTLAQAGLTDTRLLRAARLLHDHPPRLSFPFRRLQAETGLGRAQIDRLFVKEFGVSCRDYFERLRLERAIESLRSGVIPVKQIAYELGFRQPSHFSTWFLRQSGKSPSNWRRQYALLPMKS